MNSKINHLDDVKISKRLSYLLRHGAIREGLDINPDGFVSLVEVLQKLPDCTTADIRRVVSTNSKNRFTLVEDEDRGLQIKANQGHSLPSVNRLSLKPLINPNFQIIHGTYLRNWNIIKTQGLSRMKRNHIHFSKDLNFTCGLRRTAEVFIFINYSQSIENGIEFFESENGVILSPGDEYGVIEPRYFSKVVTRDNKLLSSNNSTN
ncbi:tRNA 2'-phosphotransferase 1 [Diachasma alloeum]|uniref:tRNA 2'-phosphotransferase 1 n=1 Tax=Diachasma alloeum TaxID=454923 RepID=UPI0007382493|nr:tRNA 2'-phosphotransferase 1 [Diachasma alloeum]